MIRFYAPGEIPDEQIAFSVIAARMRGEWVFCRHRDRATWEMPGGHRETGETPEAAARRELNSRKYFIMSICIQLGAAYGVSLLVYQLGRLLIGG